MKVVVLAESCFFAYCILVSEDPKDCTFSTLFATFVVSLLVLVFKLFILDFKGAGDY